LRRFHLYSIEQILRSQREKLDSPLLFGTK